MDKRQCIGLDKFYQCLSTIFPSNPNGDSQGECVSDKPTTASGKTNSHIPVKFTKDAVELLRETLTAFLRKLGRELVEAIDEGEPLSQQPIRLEDVTSVLLAFDDDHDESSCDNNAAAVDESDSDDKRVGAAAANNSSKKRAHHLPEMKEVVRQAQELMLQQKRLKGQESESHSTKRRRGETGSEGRSAKKNDTAVATSANTTTAAASAPKKRKAKRKKQKLKITAEMEAEQERLLNASKLALESSQQNKGGGGGNVTSFRVELS